MCERCAGDCEGWWHAYCVVPADKVDGGELARRGKVTLSRAAAHSADEWKCDLEMSATSSWFEGYTGAASGVKTDVSEDRQAVLKASFNCHNA